MDESRHDMFISGDGIYLRAPTEGDLDGWYRWLNDSAVTRFLNKGFFPNTHEKQKVYFERIRDNNSNVVLAIIETGGHRHIGSIGLHDIDWIHRTALIGIVIGEKEFWGMGFGKQAWWLMTRYGFETLNLHKINALFLEDNDSCKACILACGFSIEGIQKEQMYKNGRYQNLILTGMTRTDWFGNGMNFQKKSQQNTD